MLLIIGSCVKTMAYIINIFRGRTNRRNYLLGLVVLIILNIINVALITQISTLFLINTVLILVLSSAVSARRLHDFGISGLWLIIIFFGIIVIREISPTLAGLPTSIFGLCLIFIPGNLHENKYGPVPSQKINLLTGILNIKHDKLN